MKSGYVNNTDQHVKYKITITITITITLRRVPFLIPTCRTDSTNNFCASMESVDFFLHEVKTDVFSFHDEMLSSTNMNALFDTVVLCNELMNSIVCIVKKQ
jgi:hypothetical protein